MMESIDRLKKYVEANTDRTVLLTKYPEQYGVRCSTVINDLIDAVEREVEERYIEGPKDKDGVPIHLGDKVRTKLGSTYAVSRITREDFKGTTTWYIEDFASHHSLGPEDLTICKQPTVEDVLNELCLEYVKAWNGESSKRERREIVAEYAAKLEFREDN